MLTYTTFHFVLPVQYSTKSLFLKLICNVLHNLCRPDRININISELSNEKGESNIFD
jgi:hypothetical protein